jgi:hypothetical protein
MNNHWNVIEYWYSKKIVQMILHFQKEINVIMCSIEKKNN